MNNVNKNSPIFEEVDALIRDTKRRQVQIIWALSENRSYVHIYVVEKNLEKKIHKIFHIDDVLDLSEDLLRLIKTFSQKIYAHWRYWTEPCTLYAIEENTFSYIVGLKSIKQEGDLRGYYKVNAYVLKVHKKGSDFEDVEEENNILMLPPSFFDTNYPGLLDYVKTGESMGLTQSEILEQYKASTFSNNGASASLPGDVSSHSV